MSGRHAVEPVTWSPVGFIAKALLLWCVPPAIVAYGHEATGAPRALSRPDTVPAAGISAHSAEPHVCRYGPRDALDQHER